MFAKEDFQQSILQPEKRYFGFILALSIWILIAAYIYFQTTLLISEKSPNLLITLFTELFLIHLFMIPIFLGFCLIQGVNLKCKKPKSILLLSILGTVSLWLYSFSNIGPQTIGNAMLFAISAFLVLLLFFFFKVKINKLSLIGVFLGLGSVAFTYFIDRSLFIWEGFGILSGIVFAIVILLASFMIEKEPLRIGLYYSLIGFILSSIVLFLLEVNAQVWIFPSLGFVIAMIFFAVFFSSVIICFLTSFYYIDGYTFSAITCFFPASIVTINWCFTFVTVPWSIFIGTSVLALGGMIITMTNFRGSTHNFSGIQNVR